MRYEEEMMRRCRPVHERFVCSQHIEDMAIVNHINANAIEVKCSYCDNHHSISFRELTELIEEGIAVDYCDVYDGEAYYDSEKEEFSVEHWDIEELLHDEVGIVVDYKLMEHLEGEFGGKHFCKKNPYGKKKHEELAYDWQYFSQLVKYKRRFTFFYPITRETEYGYEEKYLPIAIFKDIGKAIHELNLYTLSKEPLVANFSLYRARHHDEGEVIKHVSRIGPAPKESAFANRFNPAGIPMFYGSEDEFTAIDEVVNKERKDRIITTALFNTQKPLNLIDLTALRYISPFDTKNNQYIYAVRFLQKFIEEISKPISKDGAEHINYVPSQIITEYFRDVMPHEFGVEIHGIKYYSTKCEGKICYVLFMDGENVTQDDASYDASKSLCMQLETLKRIKFEEVYKRQDNGA